MTQSALFISAAVSN